MVRFIPSYFELYSSVVTNGYLFTQIIFLHTIFHKYRGTYASFANFLFFFTFAEASANKRFFSLFDSK
jgi:hypothetical protein